MNNYKERYAKYEPKAVDEPPEIKRYILEALKYEGDDKFVRNMKCVSFKRK